MSVILFLDHKKILRRMRKFYISIMVFVVVFSFVLYPMSSNENTVINDPHYRIIRLLRNQPISVGIAVEISETLLNECEGSGVPVNLALAVLECESQFKPWATSQGGAKGLGQISPLVWGFYVRDKNLQDSRWAYSPELGVRVMVWFLGDLLTQYGSWDKALRFYCSGNSENKSPQVNRYVKSVLTKAKEYKHGG